MRFILMMFCALILAGCMFPTVANRRNAGAVTDVAIMFDTEGTLPGTPLTKQHVKNAQTNEKLVGSPEERIDPKDVEAQEANRQQAEKDIAGGGFWWIAGSSAMGVGAILATWFGLGGVSTWLKNKQRDMEYYRERAASYEGRARRYAGYFNTVVGGINRYLKRADDAPVDAAGKGILEHIGDKANETGSKAEFDEAVDAALR